MIAALRLVAETAQSRSYELVAPFAPNPAPGLHDIVIRAADEAHQAEHVAHLGVGDQPPVIAPWGYLYGPESQPEERQRQGVCQGGEVLVGAVVTDPENDPLEVTATVVETGRTLRLTRAPGDSTHTGPVPAPDVPGAYTIRFDARERAPFTRSASPRTSPLTVVPCVPPVAVALAVQALDPEGTVFLPAFVDQVLGILVLAGTGVRRWHDTFETRRNGSVFRALSYLFAPRRQRASVIASLVHATVEPGGRGVATPPAAES